VRLDRITIRIPDNKLHERLVERLVERLRELAGKRDRTVNYLVVEAILEYLKKEEGK